METTPPRFRLSCKTTKMKTERNNTSESSTTSTSTINKTNSKVDQDNDYSPIYFPTTQESNEDIDVLWDWHSPQTGERRRKKQKRLIPMQSPNVPIKRNPSTHQNANFDKLRTELRLLQEELAKPDDESCLCVSPQQEIEFKSSDDGGSNHLQLIKEQEQQCDNFNDIFNDSVDEQLMLFSQQIENGLSGETHTNHSEPKKSVFACDNSEIDDLINKYSKKSTICDKFGSKVNEEKSSTVASNIRDEKLTKTNITTTKNKFSFQRTYSDDNSNKTRNVIQTISGKLELHRTKSFELETNKYMQTTLPKSKLEEIERNRLEAMAKLASKKKRDISKSNNTTQLSPSKCSLEEIEKKRRQAQAKLEARIEEIVEKKRQEALKRLQANRMRNANLVKSTLTTRL